MLNTLLIFFVSNINSLSSHLILDQTIVLHVDHVIIVSAGRSDKLNNVLMADTVTQIETLNGSSKGLICHYAGA